MAKPLQPDTALPDQPLNMILIRHGQAMADDAAHVLGPHLSALGKVQAAAVAKRLAPLEINRIYSSDLFRANETAAAICHHKPGVPCTVIHALREIGPLHFMAAPSALDFETRKLINAERRPIRRFISTLRKSHKPGERIVIVAHGNFIRTFLPMLGGRDPRKSILLELNNTGVTLVDVWAPDHVVVRLVNCLSHLNPEQIT